jgi:hypothetical protein
MAAVEGVDGQVGNTDRLATELAATGLLGPANMSRTSTDGDTSSAVTLMYGGRRECCRGGDCSGGIIAVCWARLAAVRSVLEV